jgi:hypothetical protein
MGRGGTWPVHRVLSRQSGRGRISTDQPLTKMCRKSWTYGTLNTGLDDDEVGSCDYEVSLRRKEL